ncbi:MAG: tetratricopeptide repeat protein, partial [Candidatus Omnitrophica bacterium]|nr:tetratricopeptide repeat protein [Candidatus Omnitrophota bacterium]
ILLFSLLLISQINTIVSIDLWWNLKTGEHIIKKLEIPYTDIFSYTLKGRDWLDHEWLSQVFFYIVFSNFGWAGLNILKALVISSCFFILLFLIYSKYKKIVFAVFLILLSILAFGYRSFVRPEIFSYLFLCIYLYILEKEEKMNLLPFLQIVWVNLHGYFILGPLLLVLYAMGEFFSGDRAKAKKFLIYFLWVGLGCFMNPYFYRGVLYPFNILADVFTGQRLFMRNVHELMMPIKASFGKFILFWVFAILSSLTFIINLKNVKIKHVLIFAASFFAAYLAVRNMPIFIFLGMSVAGINLNEASLTRNVSEKKYYIVTILVIGFLLYMFMSDKYYVMTNQLGLRKTESGFSRLLMPSGACDFLEDNKIEGRIFNTLDFGPYIGYRFYPAKRIFIDTRTDLYKDSFYELYRGAQNYPEGWHELHREYGFRIVLLRHLFGGTERILRYLYEDEDWRLVYYDDNSCVFLSDIPENKEFINKFEIDFENRKLSDSDISLQVAGFFEKTGEISLAEQIYIELLREDPEFLEAGNNLATIYINSNRLDEGIDLIETFLEHYPKSAELYANIGTAYIRSGRMETGLSMLEKSARLDPYLRKASYMLGIVYLERKEIDRAMRQFIKYSRLDPYNTEVHRILGDIYREKGLLEKAAREYNEADALALPTKKRTEQNERETF